MHSAATCSCRLSAWVAHLPFHKINFTVDTLSFNTQYKARKGLYNVLYPCRWRKPCNIFHKNYRCNMQCILGKYILRSHTSVHVSKQLYKAHCTTVSQTRKYSARLILSVNNEFKGSMATLSGLCLLTQRGCLLILQFFVPPSPLWDKNSLITNYKNIVNRIVQRRSWKCITGSVQVFFVVLWFLYKTKCRSV